MSEDTPEWVEYIRKDLSQCKETVDSIDRAIRGFDGNPGIVTRVTLLESNMGRLVAILAVIGGTITTGLIGVVIFKLFGG